MTNLMSMLKRFIYSMEAEMYNKDQNGGGKLLTGEIMWNISHVINQLQSQLSKERRRINAYANIVSMLGFVCFSSLNFEQLLINGDKSVCAL